MKGKSDTAHPPGKMALMEDVIYRSTPLELKTIIKREALNQQKLLKNSRELITI